MRNGSYELVVPPEGYPGKRYRGRYAYEHHVVWWNHNREIPAKGEVIHHRNANPRDNRIENLEKLSAHDHLSQHSSQPWTYVFQECSRCGTTFRLKGCQYRTRLKFNGGKFFCSRSCQVSDQQRKKWFQIRLLKLKRI